MFAPKTIDPHFVTFGGISFSYHGECDLMMVRSERFGFGKGLEVHIRTKYRMNYSYINGVAIKIGGEVLEVLADGSLALNGFETAVDTIESINQFSYFPLRKRIQGKHKNIIVYHLSFGKEDDENGRGHIEVRANSKTGMLFLDVVGSFSDSVGMLGSSQVEGLFTRDGKKDLTDEWNSYGEEWQVQGNDPKLFMVNRAPQHPTGCRYEAEDEHRRFRGRRLEDKSGVDTTIEVATDACVGAKGHKKQFCIFDVMATGDLDIAEDSFYNK